MEPNRMARTRRPMIRRSAVAAATALVLSAALGGTTAEAAAPAGQAWTSGLNTSGQLGNGTLTSRTSFGVVPGLSNVVDVHGGREHVIALLGDGTVRTWGEGSKGAQGNGSLADRTSPGTVIEHRGRRHGGRDRSLPLPRTARRTARSGRGGTTRPGSSATAPSPDARPR